MRSHAEVIARETERLIAGWGESGTVDLLDFFAELTIDTWAAFVIGPEFCEEVGPELVPYLQSIFELREAAGTESTDLFQVLRCIENVDGTPRYPADTITGMFISLMFAGHHTTSTTSSWALLELCRHPERMARVVDELDSIYADGREVRYPALREIPTLERVSKETLRLHPPLIMLMCRVRTSALGRLPLAWPVTVLAAGMLVLFLLDGATTFVGTLY